MRRDEVGSRIDWAGTDAATFWHGCTDSATSPGRRAVAEVLGR
jgi:monoamine oxidase